MKILTKLLFMCAVVAGLAVGASAQKNDDQKKVKPPPPVINPAPPKPKEDKPKGSGTQGAVIWIRTGKETV